MPGPRETQDETISPVTLAALMILTPALGFERASWWNFARACRAGFHAEVGHALDHVGDPSFLPGSALRRCTMAGGNRLGQNALGRHRPQNP